MSALDNPELPPDLLVVSIVPILWTGVMRGRPANVCVSACEILHYAYEQFGIRSDLRAVELTILDAEGDVVRHVADPSWDGNELDGHCILCLPDDCRFVDATVEQYRLVARLGLGVIMGRTAGVLSGTAEQHEALLASTRLPAGTTLAVQRENLTLLYALADDAATDAILSHPSVRDNVEAHRRAGNNLASLSLELLRKAKAVERVRAAPYARLQALLGTIGDAPAETDDGGLVFQSPRRQWHHPPSAHR